MNATLLPDVHFIRYSHEDPCAILLACLLLTTSSSQNLHSGNSYTTNRLDSFYGEAFVGAENIFEKNRNAQQKPLPLSGGENSMVNETVRYITHLCNNEDVNM